MDNKKDNPNQLNIELPEDVAEGIYSNLGIIAHSQSEFILDFVQLMPGAPKGKVRSRVILNPIHAKRLMRMLAENVAKYEQTIGVIDEGNMQPQMNFPSSSNEA